MTRVWLTRWEWGCCGDPFAVGDEVDFGIATRGADDWLSELLGPDVAATVDAMESHHEEEFPDRVRGRVRAVHEVTQRIVERRELRRPGHGAPPDAVMPADDEEWPLVGTEVGGGVFVGSRPSRYVTESVPVPGTATLEPVRGVRLPLSEGEAPEAQVRHNDAEPPQAKRSHAGWLVDVDDPSTE